jgi:calcineurin-like phosphoesterase family protein
MRSDVRFDTVEPSIVDQVEGVALWLNHYPIAVPGDRPGGLLRSAAPGEYDLALCGHIHEKWRTRAGCINVGVDVCGIFGPSQLPRY